MRRSDCKTGRDCALWWVLVHSNLMSLLDEEWRMHSPGNGGIDHFLYNWWLYRFTPEGRKEWLLVTVPDACRCRYDLTSGTSLIRTGGSAGETPEDPAEAARLMAFLAEACRV